MVSNCAKFHYVAEGVSCSQVISYQHITLADFVKWNPTVLNDCSGMWAKVNVCVGVIGQAATTTTARVSTTTPVGNGVQTPQPTQPGMVTNCAKFHWVAKGVSCSQIISYQHITLADFVRWNPTVGSTCTNMQAEVNVCVGVTGGTTTRVKPTTTTTAGNGIQTPQPTQPGMVTNCKKFHYVAEGVSCSQIISYQHITLADFVKWNTGVGSDCRNMWAKTNVCVGV
jgi:cytochrome c-type biogenesis protein CcmH/NrfF